MTTTETRIENILSELRASLSQNTFTCSDDCHAFARQVLRCYDLDNPAENDELYNVLVSLAESWMHDEPITLDRLAAESLEQLLLVRQPAGQLS